MKNLRRNSMFMVLVVVVMFSKANASSHHRHSTEEGAKAKHVALNEESIYNLNSELLNENGQKVNLEQFRGKPVIISMAYTSCAYTCPLILSQMQQIEKKLAEAGKKDVRFVLVSFDPEKDTPMVLKAYAKKKNLSAQWDLLTAKTDKEPREIASVLGIKYNKVEGGGYDHSFIITVLDVEGVPRGHQVGADADPKDLIKLIP